MFRKFDRLAALDLPYLQSEILEMDGRVDKLHQDAENGGQEMRDNGNAGPRRSK